MRLMMSGCAMLFAALFGSPLSADDEEAAKFTLAALRAEVDERLDDRAVSLERALAADPDFAPAKWRMMTLKYDGEWLDVFDVERRARADKSLSAYLDHQHKIDDSADAHAKLANHCRLLAFYDRQRFHLREAIRRSPSGSKRQRDAMQRLAHLNVKHPPAQTVTPTQVSNLSPGAATRWYRKIRELAQQVMCGDAPRRAAAVAEIERINDPVAIPMLESVANLHVTLARSAISALANMPHPEASESLARHAVWSQFGGMRDEAAVHLKERKIHDWAPLLLSGLELPVQSRTRVQILPNRRVIYEHAFFQEGRDKISYHRAKGAVQPVVNVSYVRKFLSPDPRDWRLYSQGNFRLNTEDSLAGLRYQTQLTHQYAMAQRQQVAKANFFRAQMNIRISDTLSLITREQFTQPQEWWDWWHQYNELQEQGKKPITVSYSVSAKPLFVGAVISHVIPSCFAAGTQVWTETGPRNIEEIRPGERVLSQNVDTGEIRYNLVTGRTIRPPTALVKILARGEVISSTRGHPFWVTGYGWKMAKFLKPGDRLHTLSEPLEIEHVIHEDSAVAYNLIVADFADYFVGEHGILVHDNTPRAPTLAITPGLPITSK
jgi:hypothetical protein